MTDRKQKQEEKQKKESETAARYQISQADIRIDTQSLNLPKEFIAENRAEEDGPLIEFPILVIFLIALAFVGLVAWLISRQ